jgi:TonB family protein
MTNIGKSGLFYIHGIGEISYKPFPKELRRALFSRVEPRFLGIFLSLFIVSFFSVSILSNFKVKETVSEKDIIKIQERYAQLVLNQPKPKPPEVKVEQKVKTAEKGKSQSEEIGKKEEIKVDREKETFVQRKERREATREQRTIVREKVKAAIQTTGIFAAITASGGGGKSATSSSSGISDLLGATGEVMGDFGNIKVSKGTFAAAKQIDAEQLSQRRGEVTTGVDIAREGTQKASAKRLSSEASVNITSTPPEVKGETQGIESRSQASIQRVIDLESKRLKRVYENWLKRDPTLSGQLKIKFTIMPDGTVSNVSIVSSTTKNPEFDDTILRYVKRWTFPPVEGAGPVEVVFPFVFEAQG